MASTESRKQPPPPAYTTPTVDKSLYDSIASARRSEPTLSHTIPPRSGYAWKVPAGSIFRLSTPEGPQVGDLNLWHAQNPRERFWASRTKQIHASHVTTGDRLWSCLPYMRPMVTIIGDSIAYGVDEVGGRCHDLLGTRCDPYVNKLFTGEDYNYHCHSNLTRAVLPHGLTEFDVHDVINVFQVTGLNSEGKYFMEASPAKAGDYIEFFAEIDLLCALSTCPGGDLSLWGWDKDVSEGGGDRMKDVCRPIKVEVFEMVEKGKVLKDWKPAECPKYRGNHGMTVPTGEA